MQMRPTEGVKQRSNVVFHGRSQVVGMIAVGTPKNNSTVAACRRARDFFDVLTDLQPARRGRLCPGLPDTMETTHDDDRVVRHFHPLPRQRGCASLAWPACHRKRGASEAKDRYRAG